MDTTKSKIAQQIAQARSPNSTDLERFQLLPTVTFTAAKMTGFQTIERCDP